MFPFFQLLVSLWLWEHLFLILLNMKANFLEKFEGPQAPREEISVICFNDGLQEARILILVRGSLLWTTLLLWS